jgi:hypothetical protein
MSNIKQRVRFFVSNYLHQLESDINNFICKDEITVLSVQFQLKVENDTNHAAMVFYKEKSNPSLCIDCGERHKTDLHDE